MRRFAKARAAQSPQRPSPKTRRRLGCEVDGGTAGHPSRSIRCRQAGPSPKGSPQCPPPNACTGPHRYGTRGTSPTTINPLGANFMSSSGNPMATSPAHASAAARIRRRTAALAIGCSSVVSRGAPAFPTGRRRLVRSSRPDAYPAHAARTGASRRRRAPRARMPDAPNPPP